MHFSRFSHKTHSKVDFGYIKISDTIFSDQSLLSRVDNREESVELPYTTSKMIM